MQEGVGIRQQRAAQILFLTGGNSRLIVVMGSLMGLMSVLILWCYFQACGRRRGRGAVVVASGASLTETITSRAKENPGRTTSTRPPPVERGRVGWGWSRERCCYGNRAYRQQLARASTTETFEPESESECGQRHQ